MINGRKSAEINWWLIGQIIPTKAPKQFNGEREVFSTNVTRYPYRRKNTSIPTPHHKQKLIKDGSQT